MNLEKVCLSLQALLNLKGNCVGFFIARNDAADYVEKPRNSKQLRVKVLRVCQMLMLSRIYGWSIEATQRDLAYTCGYIFGLRKDLPKGLIRAYGEYWFKKPGDGEKKLKEIYRAPYVENSTLLTAPLQKVKAKPPVTVIYVNPAQASLILSALQWMNYEKFVFTYSGESACSDSIARCLVMKKPALTMPSYGELRFGHVPEGELVFALPTETLNPIIQGLKELKSKGVRYPIPYHGIQTDTLKGLPKRYRVFYEETR